MGGQQTRKGTMNLMSQYIKDRDRQIPIAARHADRVAGKKPINTKYVAEWSAVWNQAFLSKMEQLSYEDGLTPWMAKIMENTAKSKTRSI